MDGIAEGSENNSFNNKCKIIFKNPNQISSCFILNHRMSCQFVVNQHYDSPSLLGNPSTKTSSSDKHLHVQDSRSSRCFVTSQQPSLQPACHSSKLSEAILQRDEARDSRLCRDHSLAIRSVAEGSSFPLLLVVYAVMELQFKALTVTTASLFDECEDLEKRLTPSLMSRLKEMEIPDHLSFALKNSGGRNAKDHPGTKNIDGQAEERHGQRISVSKNDHRGGSGVDNGSTSQSQVGSSTTDFREEADSTSQRTLKTVQSGSTISTYLPDKSVELGKMGKDWLRNECLVAVTNEHYMLERLKICMDCRVNPRGITFLPCGHFVACKMCAGKTSVCGQCSKRILATVDTYLS